MRAHGEPFIITKGKTERLQKRGNGNMRRVYECPRSKRNDMPRYSTLFLFPISLEPSPPPRVRGLQQPVNLSLAGK